MITLFKPPRDIHDESHAHHPVHVRGTSFESRIHTPALGGGGCVAHVHRYWGICSVVVCQQYSPQRRDRHRRCRPKILVRPRPPLDRILFLGRRAPNDDKTTNQSIPPFSISIIFPFFVHHLLLNPADHFFRPDPCRGAILQFPDRIGHRRTRQPRRQRRRRRR